MSSIQWEIKGLSKSYGGKRALEDVDLIFKPGRIYGLIGQNGAGKTTLMRIMGGLAVADEGTMRISVNNKKILAMDARKKVGFMLDEAKGLLPNLNAYQNLRLHAKMKGASVESIEGLLNQVGLEGNSKRYSEYSLGMKQRLALACALMGEPDMLILDEPVNGLDPKGIVEIRELLRLLSREQGIGIIISSHLLEELHQLATDFILIDCGRIVRQFEKEELEKLVERRIFVETPGMEIFLETLLSRFPQLNYERIVPQRIRIQDQRIDRHLVADILHEQGHLVKELSEGQVSLERFFLEEIGGVRHEEAVVC